jgi:Mu-like prophage I protein
MEFTPEQITALLEALGLPAETDDADLIVATTVDLAAQVEALDRAKPSTVAAAAKRNGMEVIDTATADALRRDAAEGRRVAAAAAAAKVEAAINDAINTGRITPGRRTHWLTLCANDEAMIEHLASIAPGTAVPLAEVGHAADTSADLAKPAGWFY